MTKYINFPHIRKQTVTTTALRVLRKNARRKAVLIYNNGTASVELLSSQNQAYGDGIPIPAGSTYNNEHFNAQGEYFIISESADQDIRIEEDVQQDA